MSDILDFNSLQTNAKEIEEKLIKSFAPKPKFTKDERFWQPAANKANQIYAEIRFLPPFKKDGYNFITNCFHAWKNDNNKKNFYTECPTQVGLKCPICEEISELWKSDEGDNKVRRTKIRKQVKYTSVVYVVKDPENPVNEGKFFFYRYGKQIWDKIQEKIAPQSEFETPVNVFDIFTGCNFKIKGSLNEGDYMTYTKSEFATPSQIKPTMEEMKSFWNEYIETNLDVSEFLDPAKIRSYDDIKNLYIKYENFGQSSPVVQSVHSINQENVNTLFTQQEIEDIKTDEIMKVEEVLDDSIPDFDTTPLQEEDDEDLNKFLAELQNQ